MYFQLTQLEKEGYVVLEWVAGKVHDGLELLELKQIALTTSGHKLLGELRAKSRLGKVKERLSSILWAAASSVVTTLVVLAVKGA
jgi:DNA-binding PadR family transcriptional regulator